MIILVTGLPGTGKTTFARALAKALDARHLNSDIIRDELGKRGQYDPATKALVYEVLHRETSKGLANGETVIVDATFFKESLRRPYRELAQKCGFTPVWIEIKAAEEVIRERVSRKREYSEADFNVYLKIKESYEPLEEQHLILWSDRSTVPEMVRQAEEYLNLKRSGI